jgi:pSer/pThr/pTyr-binding forkhead associated (FHA) protein
MSPEFVLLALRLALALVLYAFLAATLVFLWRDLRSATLDTNAAPQGYLELLSQPGPGQVFPLSNLNLFGRADDNTIILDEETVSSHHARLSYRGGQWLLEDLGSKNGTTVNELTLEDPMVVTFGDEIRLGNVRLVLKGGQPPLGVGAEQGIG